MKLCIAEWRGMDEIPVKVSNEYLDLAKEYSTRKVLPSSMVYLTNRY